MSVVIATYRRRPHLRTVLELLTRQTHPPIEIHVVDASPAADRLGAAECARHPLLRYAVHDGTPNASTQRNRALARCAGDVVLFLDDDVEFDATLVARHVEALHTAPADAISGLVLLPGQRPAAQPHLGDVLPAADPGAPNYQAVETVVASYVVCTANFSARRSALLAVGGFDEQLSRLEDVELGRRLEIAGYRVLHHAGPRVLHLMAPMSGSRAPELDLAWMLTSLFYFQLRIRSEAEVAALLRATLWYYTRPSRHWLTPAVVRRRWRDVLAGYREARRRAALGPRLLVGDVTGRAASVSVP